MWPHYHFKNLASRQSRQRIHCLVPKGAENHKTVVNFQSLLRIMLAMGSHEMASNLVWYLWIFAQWIAFPYLSKMTLATFECSFAVSCHCFQTQCFCSPASLSGLSSPNSKKHWVISYLPRISRPSFTTMKFWAIHFKLNNIAPTSIASQEAIVLFVY